MSLIVTKLRSIGGPGTYRDARGPHDFPAVQHDQAKAGARLARGPGRSRVAPSLAGRCRLGNQSGVTTYLTSRKQSARLPRLHRNAIRRKPKSFTTRRRNFSGDKVSHLQSNSAR